MCLAKEYAEQILDIYNRVNAEVYRLKEEVSTANLFNLDMLHVIEHTNFNACEGYKLAKQIKDNQLFRRQAKVELASLIQLKEYIDRNIDILSFINQKITNTDNAYINTIENKVYNPKVMGTKMPESIVKKPVTQTKFIPIPIPSSPLSIETTIEPIGTAIHKKSKENIQILAKVDDKHYYVKRINGIKQVLLNKNISNLELLQTAK